VITAGFLKKIGPETLSTFENHILNIHPSLLPAYGGQGMYGLNVHRAVLDAGETQTGATVHWVNAHYDEGAIVAQVSLPIPDHITTPEALAGALLPHEHQLLINVLKNIASDHA
jgi:phosphoribosylglycinamide formyltransferase-1